DLKTGRVTASNAGHMDPVIMRAGGGFEYLTLRHSTIVGVFDNAVYEEYSVELEEGDCLFEYSDGVTEASDRDGVLYGAERLLYALNAHKDEEMEKLLPSVRQDIEDFVSGAAKYDDITMIGFKYFGSGA
ncbi:MAG: serine/threonine-protein phosphatase, partial [Lachnospiraceae bacterium]|nr:serine/threonine-protein phosphatase [Lachnospiraceae bacterium]